MGKGKVPAQESGTDVGDTPCAHVRSFYVSAFSCKPSRVCSALQCWGWDSANISVLPVAPVRFREQRHLRETEAREKKGLAPAGLPSVCRRAASPECAVHSSFGLSPPNTHTLWYLLLRGLGLGSEGGLPS